MQTVLFNDVAYQTVLSDALANSQYLQYSTIATQFPETTIRRPSPKFSITIQLWTRSLLLCNRTAANILVKIEHMLATLT